MYSTAIIAYILKNFDRIRGVINWLSVRSSCLGFVRKQGAPVLMDLHPVRPEPAKYMRLNTSQASASLNHALRDEGLDTSTTKTSLQIVETARVWLETFRSLDAFIRAIDSLTSARRPRARVLAAASTSE